jgi:hypothetical protein
MGKNKGDIVMAKSKSSINFLGDLGKITTNIDLVRVSLGEARDNIGMLIGALAFKQDKEYVISDDDTRAQITKAIKANLAVILVNTAKLS